MTTNINSINLKGITQSDFTPLDGVTHKGCMGYLCFNPPAYRYKLKSEGGRFIFISDDDCICQEHYEFIGPDGIAP